MQIVIDIPDEEYQKYLKMRPAYPKGVFCYIKAIQNGTPLDKIRAEIEQTAKDYDKFADYRRVRGL